MSQGTEVFYICDVIHQGKKVAQECTDFELAKCLLATVGNGIITKHERPCPAL